MQAGGRLGEEPIRGDSDITAHRHTDFLLQTLLYLQPDIFQPAINDCLRCLRKINHPFVDTLHGHVGRIIIHDIE